MMLNVLTAILVAVGFLLLFGVHPADISLFAGGEPKNMRELVLQANGERKKSYFPRQFASMRETLSLTGRADRYRHYCTAAVIFAACGSLAGVLIQNPLLVPVLAAIGLLLPPLYVALTSNRYRRMVNDQTVSALSLVTTTYLRTENLPESVHSCLPVMRGPVKEAFTTFWLQTQYANASIDQCLQDLYGRLHSGMFQAWCKTMSLCVHDHSKKSMLRPLLKEQDDIQAEQIKMDGMLQGKVKNNRWMILFALYGYLLLALIDRSWFLLMFTSLPGKIVTACVAVGIFFDLSRVARATKPLRG